MFERGGMTRIPADKGDIHTGMDASDIAKEHLDEVLFLGSVKDPARL